MSGAHTGVQQGKRVKILFKDGREPLITKFREEKSKVIHTDDGDVPIKDIRQMMIHKPL